jgi:hypothetical protein
MGFASMREGALFGTMFGLGAGAVLVGVTVSRLVVGQAPEKPAAAPPAAVAETLPAKVSSAAEPRAAVSSPAEPPAVVSSAAEPPAPVAVSRQRRAVVRKHRRPPAPEETPLATASVPTGATETVPPPPADVDRPPVAVVRGGAARPIPGARTPGPRIIQVDPLDGGR